MANKAPDAMYSIAKVRAELDAAAAEGQGRFWGTLLGKALPIAAAPFTGGASLAALPFSAGNIGGTGGGLGGLY